MEFLLYFCLLLLLVVWAMLIRPWKSTPWWPADARVAKQRSLLRILAVASAERLEAAPLVACLAEEHRMRYKWRLRRLARRLTTGLPLADALEQTPGALSDDQALAIRFGEQSGTLHIMLEDLLRTEAQAELRVTARLRQIFFYAAVTLMILGVVLGFMMIKIIPSFQAIFYDFDLELPRSLIRLITISNGFANFWWLLAIAALVGLWLWLWERSRRFIRRTITARLLRPIAAVAVGQSIGLARKQYALWSTSGRRYFDFGPLSLRRAHSPEAALCTQRNGAGGRGLGEHGAARLLEHAEATALEKSQAADMRAWAIDRLAELKRDRVERRIDLYLSLLQPAMILTLAAFVLFIAVACLSPLFNMVNALSG